MSNDHMVWGCRALHGIWGCWWGYWAIPGAMQHTCRQGGGCGRNILITVSPAGQLAASLLCLAHVGPPLHIPHHQKSDLRQES